MTEYKPTQRDIQAELKSLRLSGMAMAWADLVEQGGTAELQASRWLIEHLLQAEAVNRHMRSIAHQTKAARFPVHRDLAGFNFEASQVDRALVQKLADLSFTQDAQNVVLIGGPGTGKTHLATPQQKAEFEAGEGGVLVPVASVDKFPEALASFADLNAETAAHGIAWNVLFVAAMNRDENEGPDQIAAVDQTLEAMVSAIKAGQVDSFVPFDPSGAVVALGA